MNARRLLAIMILTLPLVALALIVGTTGFAAATVGVESPKYLDIKATELANLDRESLAKALASAMEKGNQMNGLWQNAMANYDRLLYLLLGAITALCISLAYLLWRRPTIPPDAHLTRHDS
jgi:hypothetical protein